MNKIITDLEKKQVVKRANFQVGDTVKVHYKIVEGGKERIQVYEGIVISIANKGASRSINVRRISYGIGVERIFPLYSPKIEKIEVIRKGFVRRAKLYFLREKVGKKTNVREAKRGKTIAKKKEDLIVPDNSAEVKGGKGNSGEK